LPVSAAAGDAAAAGGALKLVVWRHARPEGVAGRCIGRTDVAVDPRRAKRLAHRIRRRARREGWPRCVWTSPLRRCALVGRWLARWGWQHRVDPRLIELDFGAWDGQRWSDIHPGALDAWSADFERHAPGGGETLAALLRRCEAFLADAASDAPLLVVGHAGWINAARLLAERATRPLQAAQWPPAPAYTSALELVFFFEAEGRGALPSSG